MDAPEEMLTQSQVMTPVKVEDGCVSDYDIDAAVSDFVSEGNPDPCEQTVGWTCIERDAPTI